MVHEQRMLSSLCPQFGLVQSLSTRKMRPSLSIGPRIWSARALTSGLSRVLSYNGMAFLSIALRQKGWITLALAYAKGGLLRGLLPAVATG